VSALALNGSTIAVGTLDDGVFISTNSGTSWSEANSGLPITQTFSLAVNGATMFAGVEDFGIFLSTNSGANWTSVITDPAVKFRSLTVNATTVFSGTNWGVILYSTNTGATWAAVDPVFTHTDVQLLAANSGTVVVGDGDLLFCSNDNGSNWLLRYTPQYYRLNSLTMLDSILFIAVSQGTNSVYYSKNTGETWKDFGFTIEATSIAIGESYVFVGNGGGVWRRPRSEMSGMTRSKRQEDFPYHHEFSPHVHYSANRQAIISFSLPHADRVMVKIFNLAGHETACLVNTHLDPGLYSYLWDTRTAAPGCYIARMQAGSAVNFKTVQVVH
jgi:hypothetical protein